jgi:hypothetical protein
MRSLATLDIIGCNYSAPVIPFSSASGVVVINSNSNGGFGVGVGGDSGESSLYLMVSNEYDPMERLDKSDFPVFSIRHLATHTRAATTSVGNTNTKPPQQQQQQQQQQHAMFQSKYPIESMNYDQNIFGPEFHMRVIYSFKHNGFVYFLFTITNKMLSESCNRIDDIDTTMILSSSSLNQTQQQQQQSSSANSNGGGGGSKIVTRMLRICDTKYNAFSRTNRESTMFNSGEAVIDHIQSLYTGGAASNSATLTETVIECEDGSNGKLIFCF